jgi:aminotransferase
MINVFQPSLDGSDLEKMAEVIKTRWIGAGPQLKAFKEELAVEFGVDTNRVHLTNSCSAGLMALPHIFDITKDDSVVIPSISFPAVANSFRRIGAEVRLCDVDPSTGNVTLADIIPLVDETTKAVVVTHYGGIPVDIDPIIDFCTTKGILVIEDAACAIKSFYKGRRVGTFTDCAIWSFDPMKTLSSGDGGLMILKDKALKDKAAQWLYLGLPPSEKSGLDKSTSQDGMWWEYDIQCPGSRDVMNDLTAAVGRNQLSKLDDYISRRSNIKKMYNIVLTEVKEVTILTGDVEQAISCDYFYTIACKRRDELAIHLKDHGIYTTFRYWPLHKTTSYSESPASFPNTELMCNTCLNLPIHDCLTENDVSVISQLIKDFFSK